MRGDRPFTYMAQKNQGTDARNFAVLHEQLGEVDGRPTGDDYHRPTVEECIYATIRAMPQEKLDWDIRHPADCGCRVCSYRRGEDFYVSETSDEYWKEARQKVEA
jgi:hypothetical protein